MILLLENLQRRWAEFRESRLLVEQWRAVWTRQIPKYEEKNLSRVEPSYLRSVGWIYRVVRYGVRS